MAQYSCTMSQASRWYICINATSIIAPPQSLVFSSQVIVQVPLEDDPVFISWCFMANSLIDFINASSWPSKGVPVRSILISFSPFGIVTTVNMLLSSSAVKAPLVGISGFLLSHSFSEESRLTARGGSSATLDLLGFARLDDLARLAACATSSAGGTMKLIRISIDLRIAAAT